MKNIIITEKGIIQIPRHILKKYKIGPGSHISLIERENEIVMRPQGKEIIKRLCGILKNKSSATKELLRERAKDRKYEDTKISKSRS